MTKRALKRMVREAEFNPGQFEDDGKVRRLPIERRLETWWVSPLSKDANAKAA